MQDGMYGHSDNFLQVKHHLAIPLLAIYPKEIKIYFQTETSTQMPKISLFKITPNGKKSQNT